MAEEDTSLDDRTEEATPERREEFREKGQIAVSKEITGVVVLAACIGFLTAYMPKMYTDLSELFVYQFQSISWRKITTGNVLDFALSTWITVLWIVIPLFLASVVAGAGATFIQTRFNWSWKKLKPDFSRMNPLKGVARMVNMQAAMELFKGVGKMAAVSLVSYLILYGEWSRVPALMTLPVPTAWGYWTDITLYLFWAVTALLLVIGGVDYLYNYQSLERRLKMTKQEVKEEFKRREVDAHVKARMRRMQRDLAMRKTMEATKEATVLITNPTHYSVALKYELGMAAPLVIAKGVDLIALKMREVANELDIPIVENRPLARSLYAIVKEGEEIPDRFYKAVAEIIRYVFKLKGRPIPSQAAATQTS